MKLIQFLTTLVVATVASAKPAFTTKQMIKPSTAKLLEVRGGGSLGPIDADLLGKVGSTSLALYVGSSACKFVASQTGGTAPEVSINQRNAKTLMKCISHIAYSLPLSARLLISAPTRSSQP